MTVGRNDSCPCGSGKKYKKCCIALTPQDLAKFYYSKSDSNNMDRIFESDIDLLANSVMDLIQAKKFDEAENVCRKLLDQFPEQVDGLSCSALVFQAQENFLKAADYTEKAIAFMRKRKDEYDSEIIEEMEKDLQNLKKKIGNS